MHGGGALGPVPGGQHLDAGLHQRRRGRARRVRRAGRAVADPSPGRTAGPRTRPGSGPSVILPDSVTPSFAMPVGHCLRGARSTPGRSSRALRLSTAAASTVASGARRCSCRTARTARRRRPDRGRRAGGAGTPSGTWWSAGSRASPAARTRGPARAGRTAPRRTSHGSPGADPAAADPAYGAVDVEDLEHHLQPGAAQFDQRLERLRGLRPVGVEDLDHPAHQRAPAGTRREAK